MSQEWFAFKLTNENDVTYSDQVTKVSSGIFMSSTVLMTRTLCKVHLNYKSYETEQLFQPTFLSFP